METLTTKQKIIFTGGILFVAQRLPVYADDVCLLGKKYHKEKM
jgi:hypothetical protein